MHICSNHLHIINQEEKLLYTKKSTHDQEVRNSDEKASLILYSEVSELMTILNAKGQTKQAF